MKSILIRLNPTSWGRARIWVAVGVFAVACGSPLQPENGDALVGRWVWVESIGGIAGRRDTPESTGMTRSMEVSVGGVLNQFQDDTVAVVSERITVVRALTIMRPDTVDVIRFADRGEDAWLFEFRGGDTLVLTDLCIDCFAHTWARRQ